MSSWMDFSLVHIVWCTYFDMGGVPNLVVPFYTVK